GRADVHGVGPAASVALLPGVRAPHPLAAAGADQHAGEQVEVLAAGAAAGASSALHLGLATIPGFHVHQAGMVVVIDDAPLRVLAPPAALLLAPGPRRRLHVHHREELARNPAAVDAVAEVNGVAQDAVDGVP